MLRTGRAIALLTTVETLPHTTYNVSSGRPSITPVDNPFEPVDIRGRVVEWIERDEAWEIIDRLVAKYIDERYPRDDERVVLVVEPEHQKAGMG